MKGDLFKEKLRQNIFLIMAHRGFWGGNIIENSKESAQLAYKAGADIVEVDVCRTIDGKYYLFHDGNEPKLLNRKENFRELSSQEVDSSNVYNSIGSISGYKINTLMQFLEWLPENRLVNLDRSWDYWNDPGFFQILSDSGKQDQLVLKSPVAKEYLAHFAQHGKGYAYIPIVKSREEFEYVRSYRNVRTIGLEVVISNWENELLEPAFLEQVRRDGLFLVANAENLGSAFNLFAGQSDDVALFQDGDWHAFVRAGMDVIQTDWPPFLYQYRELLKQVGE